MSITFKENEVKEAKFEKKTSEKIGLKLGKIKIKNIEFGEKSEILNRILIINREELRSLLLEDKNLKDVDVKIARPGESKRIIPIKDVIEPRVKVRGSGEIFPGFFEKSETVGNGITHVLKGVAVVTTGRIVNFQEGLIDMSGPGANYSPWSKTNNVVIVCTPVNGMDKHTHERTVRLAGLKAAYYLGQFAKDVEPDENEFYEYLPFPTDNLSYSILPRVVFVHMLLSQGLLHDTYVYGIDAKGILPTIISPTELMDGAIVSGNCAAPCHKHTTYHQLNNPIVEELYKRHKKDLYFAGVVLINERTDWSSIELASSYAVNLVKLMNAQGAIITEDGGGNPETILMALCKKLEKEGIKTVLVTDEYAGRDGASQGLADITAEANAVVTNGNGNQFVTLPPMDETIGELDTIDIITGGHKGSLKPDGSIEMEIAGIMGATCELGYSNLTTRLR